MIRLVFRPLLGLAEEAETKTTPLGIRYNAQGFDHPRREQIQETIDWLKTQNLDSLSFEAYALELTENPTALPQWIDATYSISSYRWEQCGGVWAWTVRANKPSSFLITLRQEPIQDFAEFRQVYSSYKEKLYEARAKTSIYSKAEIHIMACAMTVDGHFKRIDNLLSWEWGNLFDRAMGTYRQRKRVEIGDRSPCVEVRN